MIFGKKNKETEKDDAPLGIWNEDVRKANSDRIRSMADTVRVSKHQRFLQAQELKARKWGLWNVFWAFLAFLGLQLGASLILYYIAYSSLITSENLTVDQGQLLDAVTKLLQAPLVLIFVQVVMYVTWLGYMAYATYRRGLKSWFKDFWLKFKWSDIPLGAAIAIGLVLAQSLILWLIPTLFPDLNMQGVDNASFLNDQSGLWFIIIGFGIVGIVGPFCEELFFRGFVMQGLLRYFRRNRRSTPTTVVGQAMFTQQPIVYDAYLRVLHWTEKHKYSLSVIISSILFGSLHFQGTETFGQWLVPVVTGLIGVVLALVTLKTRRLGLGIMIHIFFNTSGVILSLFS